MLFVFDFLIFFFEFIFMVLCYDLVNYFNKKERFWVFFVNEIVLFVISFYCIIVLFRSGIKDVSISRVESNIFIYFI